jgi:hypothetical protein
MPNRLALPRISAIGCARGAKNVELAIDSISDEQPSSDYHLGLLQRFPERENGNINVVESDGTYDSAALRKPRVQETTPCQRPPKRRFAFGGRSRHGRAQESALNCSVKLNNYRNSLFFSLLALLAGIEHFRDGFAPDCVLRHLSY